jgi:hypothetical protein
VSRLLAAGVAVLAAFAATAGAQEVPTRSCSTRGEPSSGRLGFGVPTDVVLGPVAFTAIGRLDPRAIFRHPGHFSVKSAAKVRAGRAVTVSVPAAFRDRFSLAYARGARFDRFDPSLALTRFEPCPPETPAFVRGRTVGAITGFPGGFVFKQRGCYPLEVRVAGRARVYRRTVRFGVARCG